MSDEESIRRIMREAVHETLRGLGFNTEHPHEIQADLIYLNKVRKGSEELSRLIKKSVITVAVPSVLYLAWEVFRQAVVK